MAVNVLGFIVCRWVSSGYSYYLLLCSKQRTTGDWNGRFSSPGSWFSTWLTKAPLSKLLQLASDPVVFFNNGCSKKEKSLSLRVITYLSPYFCVIKIFEGWKTLFFYFLAPSREFYEDNNEKYLILVIKHDLRLYALFLFHFPNRYG